MSGPTNNGEKMETVPGCVVIAIVMLVIFLVVVVLVIFLFVVVVVVVIVEADDNVVHRRHLVDLLFLGEVVILGVGFRGRYTGLAGLARGGHGGFRFRVLLDLGVWAVAGNGERAGEYGATRRVGHRGGGNATGECVLGELDPGV